MVETNSLQRQYKNSKRCLLQWMVLLGFSLTSMHTACVVQAAQSAVDSSLPAGESIRQPVDVDLTEMSIEELMDIEVTVASKKKQKLSQVPAAIFVLTQEDIRRSGVTSIPEALRLVPGLQVARIDANKWAITARGFNDRFANKLLVLMDGRSVYTPLYSGVFWNTLDTLMEDIDRIEVIRGPGAAVWGANAVNGVINIITKKAQDTQGMYLRGGAGNEEKINLGARYGGALADASYRVYAKYFQRDSGLDPDGGQGYDDWDGWQSGFRYDSAGNESDSVSVQANAFGGKVREKVTVWSLYLPYVEVVDSDQKYGGTNVLGRWEHTFSQRSKTSVQLYYDLTDRRTELLDEVRHTADLELQYQLSWGKYQDIVLGLGYRYTQDDLEDTTGIAIIPDSREDHLFSSFIQDEIMLLEDQIWLTLGSKFEHNDYTGFEVQPNARLMWTPEPRHSLWAAASRAVRTPSRVEDDVRILAQVTPGTPSIATYIEGDEKFQSEILWAYELGYRFLPTSEWSLDFALFYNDYDNLRTIERQGLRFAGTRVENIFVAENNMEGRTCGAEVATDWEPVPWWRLSLAYTYLEVDLRVDSASNDTTAENGEGRSPNHQFSLRSSMDVAANVSLDMWLRYISDLEGLGVDEYTSMDLRLAWQPVQGVELSLVGQNLLHSGHQEYGTPEFVNTTPTEVERTVFGQIEWKL